jgi:MoaA/NifB/PqqE/SkfB family radical SAM enzyme
MNLDKTYSDFTDTNIDEIIHFTKNRNNFIFNDYIESGDEEDKEPVNFSWELTYYCQYRCTYCYAFEQLTKKPDPKLLKAYPIILKKLKLRSIPKFNIELLGGEPTTHPNIFEIIEELNKNEKCKSIELVTNIAKPVSFYKKFDDEKYNKLIISASYHNEYDKNDRYLKKCIELNKFKNVRFFSNINFAPEKEKWSKTFKLIKDLSKNNVMSHFNLLHSTKQYEGFDFGYDYKTGESCSENNTDQMMSMVLEFLNFCKVNSEENFDIFKNTIQRNIRYKDKKGKEVYIPELLIRALKLDRFYGWKCSAKMWSITPLGNIHNDCTNENLDILNKKLTNCVTCPLKTGCQCDLMLNYRKIRQ